MRSGGIAADEGRCQAKILDFVYIQLDVRIVQDFHTRAAPFGFF
jgi:hypothetical protein